MISVLVCLIGVWIIAGTCLEAWLIYNPTSKLKGNIISEYYKIFASTRLATLNVVYFNQLTGAPQAIRWSKSSIFASFYTFNDQKGRKKMF